MTNNKIILGAIVGLVVLGLGFVIGRISDSPVAIGGTPGTALLIENYLPVVKYNGGIYSELPIQTTDVVTAAGLTSSGANSFSSTLALTGSTTLASTLDISGAARALSTLTVTATTTLSRNLIITTSNTATSSAQLGCVQTYATSTATAIHLQLGNSVIATTTYEGVNSQGTVTWAYGNCPRI